MPTLTGTYRYNKANWFTVTEPGQAVTNYGRFQLAHSGASSYNGRSYNFELSSPSTYNPTNDTNNRITSHNIGVSGGAAVTGGYDFLWRGNYIHPTLIVQSVNGVTLDPPGQAYYAGDSTSFDSGSPPGPITRGWMEIICQQDLPTIASLVDGNSYNIVIYDASVTRTFVASASAAYNVNNGIITIPNITIPNNVLCIVYTICDGPDGMSSVGVPSNYNVSADNVAFIGDENGPYIIAWSVLGTGNTGSITASSNLANSNIALIAIYVSNLTNNAYDNAEAAYNTSGSANSGGTATIGTNGPVFVGACIANSGASWSAPRAIVPGASIALPNSSYTMYEGYLMADSGELGNTIQAQMTSSGDWGAMSTSYS